MGTSGNGGHEVKGSAFALKAAVSFSVSSLEPAPVVSAQPLICPCWELRWSSLRSETPSPATTSCTSGRSPYMTYEVWVPRSSTASSVLGPSTTSVSKISSPVDAASTHFSGDNGRQILEAGVPYHRSCLLCREHTQLGVRVPALRGFCSLRFLSANFVSCKMSLL